jgi:hypothetical protein
MNVIGHNAESIELKLVFVQSLLDGIEKHLPTFSLLQFKLTIVTAYCDVVRMGSSQFCRGEAFR